MAYSLPALGYAFDALEPHIDARTMEIHHGKHHQAYINNVNAALEGSDLGNHAIEDLLINIKDVPEDKRQVVINNGGGHANHALFWEIIGPNGGGDPTGALADAINHTFTDLATFKAKFGEAATKRFGSGWAWLVVTADKKLEVLSTANQDSPLMNGQTPILGLDVWEHAYYLNYQNRRPDYIAAAWNVFVWDKVAEKFEKAMG
ncbi:MAG: hypothetical protein RLZZ303_2542 [Candidatus Hydrogenedentota bacterium]|jgi:Fe-Mn family superoxide dismutase